MTPSKIGPILHAFFENHLKMVKGLRPASIWSYRDVMRLFLSFIASDVGHRITRLSIQDFTFERVLRFLSYLEEQRANNRRTRNHRLAVLHSFFEYLAFHNPEMLDIAERVATIPMKRTIPPETTFLLKDEIDMIFRKLPTKGKHALRNRVLLLFLYNTGARAQEVAELRVVNLELGKQPRVHLHGKGDRWRTCPLWNQTAQSLSELLQENGSSDMPQSPVFASRHEKALGRFGIYKIVRCHTACMQSDGKGKKQKRISPHTFRHTAAVHLLESGVEVNVIRGWLGHASLDTTNRYAEITLRLKEDALRACEPPLTEVSEEYPRRSIWQDDENLLKWLNSL